MTEEQEQTKERTGWIITFLAAFLAITSLLDGGNSS
jgi:preprotein translocase subunit SecE